MQRMGRRKLLHTAINLAIIGIVSGRQTGCGGSAPPAATPTGVAEDQYCIVCQARDTPQPVK